MRNTLKFPKADRIPLCSNKMFVLGSGIPLYFENDDQVA